MILLIFTSTNVTVSLDESHTLGTTGTTFAATLSDTVPVLEKFR